MGARERSREHRGVRAASLERPAGDASRSELVFRSESLLQHGKPVDRHALNADVRRLPRLGRYGRHAGLIETKLAKTRLELLGERRGGRRCWSRGESFRGWCWSGGMRRLREREETLASVGVAAIVTHDALSRALRTNMPDGTASKVQPRHHQPPARRRLHRRTGLDAGGEQRYADRGSGSGGLAP